MGNNTTCPTAFKPSSQLPVLHHECCRATEQNNEGLFKFKDFCLLEGDTERTLSVDCADQYYSDIQCGADVEAQNDWDRTNHGGYEWAVTGPGAKMTIMIR